MEAFKQKQPDGALGELVAAEGVPALGDYSPELHKQGSAFRTDILAKEVATNKIIRWSHTASGGEECGPRPAQLCPCSAGTMTGPLTDLSLPPHRVPHSPA